MYVVIICFIFMFSKNCVAGSRALRVIENVTKAVVAYTPSLPPARPLPTFSALLSHICVTTGRYPRQTSSRFPTFTHEAADFEKRVLDQMKEKHWDLVTIFMGCSHVAARTDFAAFARLCEAYVITYCDQHQKEDLLLNRSSLACGLYTAINTLLRDDLFSDFDYTLIAFWSEDMAKSVENILYTATIEAEEFPYKALSIQCSARAAVESMCRGI